MSAWSPENINEHFYTAAQHAEQGLLEAKQKVAQNPNYKFFADEDLARFHVFWYLHGKTFLQSREELLFELRSLLANPPKPPQEAYNPTVFLDMYAGTLRSLISQYEKETS